MDKPASTSSRMVTVIGFIAIIAAAYFARGLMLPLALAEVRDQVGQLAPGLGLRKTVPVATG